MTDIPFQPASLSGNSSWAGGEASGPDLMFAAADQQNLVENSVAAHDALEQAYQDRIAAIKARTGQDRPNPMVDEAGLNPFTGPREPFSLYRDRTKQQSDFENWLWQLQAEHPEAADVIRAGTPVSADAEALARQSDTRLAQVMQSHPGWDKYVWSFLGAGGASLRDPMVVGSFFFGGGAGAEKTVAGRILGAAARDAAVNAASTAAAQPMVQDWRQKVGLDAGFSQALQSTLAAGTFGAVAGGGLRALGEAAGAVLGASPHVAPELKAAAAGDASAGAATLAPIRDTLAPEARGAIDAAETFTPPSPEALDAIRAQREELLQSHAAFTAQLREPAPLVLPDDEAQIARIADRLAPAPDTLRDFAPKPVDAAAIDQTITDMRQGAPLDATGTTRPVARFIRDLGGVNPASPLADELRSRGITSRTLPGLFNRRGIRTATAQGVATRGARSALDNIPIDELPPEIRSQVQDDGNGYARQQDLVDALEAEDRAQPGVSALDEQRQALERQGVDFNLPDAEVRARLVQIEEARARFDAAQAEIDSGAPPAAEGLPPRLTLRATAENAVRAVQRHLGGNYADDVVHAVADLVLHEREPVADAADFVLGREAGVPPDRIGAPVEPGPLDAVGSSPPEPAGLDNPGAPTEPSGAGAEAPDPLAAELDALPADLSIPTDEGLATAATLKADIEKSQWLEKVVDACKA